MFKRRLLEEKGSLLGTASLNDTYRSVFLHSSSPLDTGTDSVLTLMSIYLHVWSMVCIKGAGSVVCI